MKKLFTLSLLSLLTAFCFGQTQIQMQLPAQTGTFGSNVRGYWFQAPTCFTITGLQVPTDASSGNQSIAVLRLPAAPPLFSTTTNNFTVEFLVQNDANNGIYNTNIQVGAGQYIVIIGYRGTTNSYASGAPHTTQINGMNVSLGRAGMQFPLTTTAPQNIWSEAGGSISRVFMYYDTAMNYNLTANITMGLTVDFAAGADSSFTTVWDYGDGSPLDTTYDPTYTYASAGVYNACVYIDDGCGIDTLCTLVSFCSIIPSASFSHSSTGLTTNFTDASTNTTSWFWDFGDGNTDTTQNPTHTYATTGTYTACLIATSSCGATDTICDTVSVCVPPTAGITWVNQGGDTLNFMDAGANATSWFWAFGDGGTSLTQNPQHIYTTAGTYQVCLISTNPCGTDTICDSVDVCVGPVLPGFMSSVSGGTVMFTDTTVGSSNWMWDFGDGNSSNMQNPTHTYATNGTYVPCLTTWNNCGDTASVCGDTLVICIPPSASWTWTGNTQGTVMFTHTGMPAGTSWNWNFGDSNNSTMQNPTHTYAFPGMFNVCLTVMDSCGQDTFCDSVNVLIIGVEDPNMGFTVDWIPNPFSESALVKISGDVGLGEVQLELYDLQGRKVYTDSGDAQSPFVIRRNGIAAGTYMYRVQTDDGRVVTGRVVAE